jgi:DivIVA domain-containing protein
MPEFSLVLRGYNTHQVDEVVAQVEGTLGRRRLEGGPITFKQLTWTSFEVVMRGYDRFEVDGAMRCYRRELAELEGREPPDEEADGGLAMLMGSWVVPAELLERIRSAHRFRVRWRGYDRHQVEQYLARIWMALDRDDPGDYGELEPITPAELVNLPFDVVLRGYEMGAVEQAIDRYRRELAGA